MQYLFLTAAIASEILATLALRVAANGRTALYGVVVVGYVVAFSMLNGALRHGMPLGVAYGVWVATGVAVIALASRMLFRDPLTYRMMGGIALIAGGVLLVELGAGH
jgi:small multidrug resistance pump